MTEGTKLLQALVHNMHTAMNTIEDYASKKGVLEKYMNSGKIDPTDPDQYFYIRHISSLGEFLTRIKMYVTYIDAPIKKEGVLRLANDGRIIFGDEIFEPGHIIEYYMNEQWEIGILQKSKNDYYIIDAMLTERQVQIDELHVRVR